MPEATQHFTGGCLCGALRYTADGAPLYAGLCFCTDCQKASGSAFIPFLGVAADAVRVTGESRASVTKAAHGGDATRNFCVACGSMVFGGERGRSTAYTIYAGSLDDTAQFSPQIAIFTRSRPAWDTSSNGLTCFETVPSR